MRRCNRAAWPELHGPNCTVQLRGFDFPVVQTCQRLAARARAKRPTVFTPARIPSESACQEWYTRKEWYTRRHFRLLSSTYGRVERWPNCDLRAAVAQILRQENLMRGKQEPAGHSPGGAILLTDHIIVERVLSQFMFLGRPSVSLAIVKTKSCMRPEFLNFDGDRPAFYSKSTTRAALRVHIVGLLPKCDLVFRKFISFWRRVKLNDARPLRQLRLQFHLIDLV